MKKTENKSSGFIGLGIFSAFAASICCITPVLAFLSGTSGLLSTFSWIEPARPFLIAFTLGILGFAWYQKLIPQKNSDPSCGCEDAEKKRFWQSKSFLGIVTIVALVMIAFPYYAESFYPSNQDKEAVVAQSGSLTSATFSISGMTCQGCAAHVEHEVNKLSGIHSVKASYDLGNAIVKFDASKTSLPEIENAINDTGYSVDKSMSEDFK